MAHQVYAAIVRAVRCGILCEPFNAADCRKACAGFGNGTYGSFLPKHAAGNPDGNSALFKRVARGKYRCIRPFKYRL